MVAIYRDTLRAHQEELNRLNVYPVPDGDTGTNMALTLESVCAELDGADDMPEVCRALAHGSLMGARGNSGVILSQILRGMSETFSRNGPIDAGVFTQGLRRAADAAYQAVLRPVEGTILTVVRTAAEAAERARAAGEQTMSGLVDRVVTAAHEAVARTPELLPVLKEAGVVDAGGRGFALLLDVVGRALPEPEVVATPAAVAAHLRDPAVAAADFGALRYEVMFFLCADDERIDAFRSSWGQLGDSIVVVGGDGLWNCHIHTNDVGAAIEAGVEAGRPSRIQVTDLRDQVEREEAAWVVEPKTVASTDSELPAAEACTTAVVAVATGDGVHRLLRSLGVHEVVAGGQSMNPSTAELLRAVDACPADAVVVLPNNKNIVPVAEQLDALTTRRVELVSTHAVVEGLAALVAYDGDVDADANARAMAEAAGRVHAGEVTRAIRDAVAECGTVKQGDWMAITADGIQAALPTTQGALIALVDGLVQAESELVTVLVGSDAAWSDVNALRDHLDTKHPHVEVEVHDGGQALYPFLVGVE